MRAYYVTSPLHDSLHPRGPGALWPPDSLNGLGTLVPPHPAPEAVGRLTRARVRAGDTPSISIKAM